MKTKDESNYSKFYSQLSSVTSSRSKYDDDALWQKYFKLPNPGLRAYFEHVRSGQSEEYRTPFYKGKSLESILKGWDSHIESLKTSWPTLVDFENDLRKKVGPMSIMLPLKDRISDIDSYYDSILLESEPISEEAKAALLTEWKPKIGGLCLKSAEQTVLDMKKSTNSGCPYFTERKAVVEDTMPCTVDGTFQKLPTGVWGVTAVLGWRGQEGGPEKDDVKQRVIWMFPFAVNIQELRLYQPLIQSVQKFNLVPAWVSMERVDREITKLFDTKGQNDLVICTDFSKFDQHFNRDMQNCAHDVLEQLGVESKWLADVFPIKYSIPLAIDWGKIRYGNHGMGSGSGGTNADETITHRCLQHEAAIDHGSILNPHSQCLGDDGILSYPGCSVDDVMRSYTKHGQEMNTDKQYASTQDCVYLRRWHHKDYRVDGVCVGVYSTYRALGRLAEQERFYDPTKWNSKMVALRQLSILENVKYHPLREEFVRYCMKGDKYRLGLDIPGFLDNIESEAQKAIEYMPDFLGYTKTMQLDTGKRGSDQRLTTGIGSWWIVKYLKSMSKSHSRR
uniref:RNA-dependent RNA polymerase n=1 Tax=Bovine picobirnavirus TaxID=1977295 RepID=A0A4Y1KD97_9VIRU|nr:RNA-dependent RNA polymerase [Bovine picobirnavirus]